MARSSAQRVVKLVCLGAFMAFALCPTHFASLDVLWRADGLAMGGSALASRAWLSALPLSLGMLLITLFKGRVFCAWVCPLGTLQDGCDALLGRKAPLVQGPRLGRPVLAAVLGLAGAGLSLTWVLDPLVIAERLVSAALPLPVFAVPAVVALLVFVAIEIAFGRRGFCRLCPFGALQSAVAELGKAGHTAKPDQIIRRSTLTLLGGALGAGLLWRHGTTRHSLWRLRPPGALPESELGARCIRCKACLRACPTLGLVPETSLMEPSLLETPVLCGRAGGCAYECAACGQVCPTGAIRPLALPDKQRTVLGLAVVSRRRCVAYAKHQPCRVCYMACPVDAILMLPYGQSLPWGEALLAPFVEEKACVGCGLCEARCPVSGSAIVVGQKRDRRPKAQ